MKKSNPVDSVTEDVTRDPFSGLVDRHTADPEERMAFDDGTARRALIDLLVRERSRRGWSQIQLARRLKVTQSAVSDFEKRVAEPRLNTLQRWARAFGFRLELQIWKGPLELYNSWNYRKLPYETLVRSVHYNDAIDDIWFPRAMSSTDEIPNVALPKFEVEAAGFRSNVQYNAVDSNQESTDGYLDALTNYLGKAA